MLMMMELAQQCQKLISTMKLAFVARLQFSFRCFSIYSGLKTWKPAPDANKTLPPSPSSTWRAATFSVCCLFAWLWRITLNGVFFSLWWLHLYLSCWTFFLPFYFPLPRSALRVLTRKDVRKSSVQLKHVEISYFFCSTCWNGFHDEKSVTSSQEEESIFEW